MPQQIIVPRYKTVSVAKGEETQEGSVDVIVGLEVPSLYFSLYTSQVGPNSSVSYSVYELDDGITSRGTKLGDSVRISDKSQSPARLLITPGGPVRVEIEWTGTVTYNLRARNVDGVYFNSVEEAAQARRNEDLAYREELLAEMCAQTDLLKRILNHQRYTTDILQDDGEGY